MSENKRVVVNYALSDEGIDNINANPEMPMKQREQIDFWKDEGLVEHYYNAKSNRAAFLVFRDITEPDVREKLKSLPYYPYMELLDLHVLEREF